MPMRQLIDILRLQATIPGVSDTALIANVHRQMQRDAARGGMPLPYIMEKALAPAAGLDRGQCQIRPIEALLRLSRATALTLSPTAAAVARWWPILRYLGAFARTRAGGLCLDAAATQHLRGNERRVLSEELGVGFGILLGEQWCRTLGATGAISAIDPALIIGDPTNMVSQTGRLIPDYILRYRDRTRPGAHCFAVIECKGTQQAGGSTSQLGHAMRQIDALRLGNDPLPGVGISTISNSNYLGYRAVDPPDATVIMEFTDEELRSAREEIVSADVNDRFVTVDKTQFLRAAVLLDNAALAAFGGDGSTAREWAPSTQRAWFLDDGPTPSSIDNGEWTGSTLRIPVDDGELELFGGVANSVLDALKTKDESQVSRAQRAFAFEDVGTSAMDTDNSEARAISPDGSILLARLRRA